MEDSGIEQMTEETERFNDETLDPASLAFDPDRHDAANNNTHSTDMEAFTEGGVIRTLDGEIAGDEFAQDAMNYQILLGKIDSLLDSLTLDA